MVPITTFRGRPFSRTHSYAMVHACRILYTSTLWLYICLSLAHLLPRSTGHTVVVMDSFCNTFTTPFSTLSLFVRIDSGRLRPLHIVRAISGIDDSVVVLSYSREPRKEY